MNGTEPPRDGNRDPHMAPHGVFRSAGEDRWVSIAVGSDEEWRSLVAVIGDGELSSARYATLADRKRHEDEIEARLTRWTTTLSADEVTRRLQAAGVAAFPTMTNQDLAEDPHLNGRGFFVDVPHPEVGKRHHAGIPWKLSKTPCAVTAPAPCLGEHSREVLSDVLGYSEVEIEALAADGALG
jgi:crotonobetainyl-CoA:carnitine CoA-transferase CaiB-like acyl-CoA transferase